MMMMIKMEIRCLEVKDRDNADISFKGMYMCVVNCDVTCVFRAYIGITVFHTVIYILQKRT